MILLEQKLSTTTFKCINQDCNILPMCYCNKDFELLDTRTCLSSASLSWNLYRKIYQQLIKDTKIGNFDDKVCKQFIWNSIHGGWVAAYKAYWKKGANNTLNEDDDSDLEDFDANSLYGSVMADNNIQFPDINSYQILNSDEINYLNTIVNNFDEIKNKYKHFIFECDIFVPKELKFIPISIKEKG